MPEPAPITPPAPPAEDFKAKFEAAERAKADLLEEVKALKPLKTELETLRSERAERLAAEQKAKDEAERAKLTTKGEFDKALQATEEKHSKASAEYRQKVADKFVPALVKDAARALGNVMPTVIGDLPLMLRDHLGYDSEALEAFVKGPDGKPLLDDKMNPVKLDTFIAGWLKSRPHFLKDGMLPGSGLKPTDKAGAAAGYTVEAAKRDAALNAKWKAEDPEGHKKAWAEYQKPENAQLRAREALGLK